MDQSRENIIEDSQDEIDIGELLRFLKTKWIVIVGVFLIGVIGAGVGTKCLITPKYTAVSKLYVVCASGKNIVNLDDLRLGTTLSSDYTELLKTRPICNEIISDLGLDYTVGQLKSMISIVPIEDTRLLTVSVVSADPEEAKNIANTLADKAVTYLPKLMGISAPNIAEEAITPAVPSSPSTKKNVALGGILALALIVGISSTGAAVALIVMFALMSYNNKHSFTYQYNQGLAAEATGDHAQALDYFIRAEEMEPDNLDVKFEIADIYLSMDQKSKAITVLEGIIATDDSNKKAYKELIGLYEEDSDYDAIMALYQTADSDSVRSLFSDYLVSEPKFGKKSGNYEESIKVSITAEED